MKRGRIDHVRDNYSEQKINRTKSSLNTDSFNINEYRSLNTEMRN